ncbi:hypothetical protein C0991_001609, partial [Blastosporella zonata]
QEPPSRGDEVNIGDEGGMELVSLAVKAEEDAKAAWGFFQAEESARAVKTARKQKTVNNLEFLSPMVAKQTEGCHSVNQNPVFQKVNGQYNRGSPHNKVFGK